MLCFGASLCGIFQQGSSEYCQWVDWDWIEHQSRAQQNVVRLGPNTASEKDGQQFDTMESTEVN